MKKQILAASTAMGLFITLAVVFAQAQSSRNVKISVPYEFVIDNETLPSGEYTIQRTSRNRPKMLTIRSKDGSITKIFTTQRVESQTPQAVSVIFNKYGTQYFLAQVWPDSSMNGYQLIKCQSELELEARSAETEEAPKLQKVVLGN